MSWDCSPHPLSVCPHPALPPSSICPPLACSSRCLRGDCPRAACHLLLPSLLVWEQPFAVLSSGCHGGRKEGRKDPFSRSAPHGRSEISGAALLTACVFLLGGRQGGESPQPSAVGASHRSRSHEAPRGHGSWPKAANPGLGPVLELCPEVPCMVGRFG